MRVLIWLAIFATDASLFSAEQTALGALKLLPKEKAAKLARIEARDGTPAPDRWYLLINDPDEPSGVHEFVVANDEVVASRAISQFAELLAPADVIGSDAVKVDTDQLARLARQYAQANGVSISKFNYELKKEGAEATPLWKVTCFGEDEKRLGEIVVTATKGNIISHDGFAAAPHAAVEKHPKKLNSYAESPVTQPAATPEPAVSPEQNARRRDVDEHGNPIGNTFKNVGRSIRHFLPF